MKFLLLLSVILGLFSIGSALKGPGYILQSCSYGYKKQKFIKLFDVKQGKMLAQQELDFSVDGQLQSSTPKQWVDTFRKMMVSSDHIGARHYVKIYKYGPEKGFVLQRECSQGMLRNLNTYFVHGGVLYSTFVDEKRKETMLVEWEDDCSSYEEVLTIPGASPTAHWEGIHVEDKSDWVFYTRALKKKEIDVCWFSLSVGQSSLKCEPTNIRESDVNSLVWDPKDHSLFLNGNSYTSHVLQFAPDFSSLLSITDLPLKPYYGMKFRNHNSRRPYYMAHFNNNRANKFYDIEKDRVIAEYPKMSNNDEGCRMMGRSKEYEVYDSVPFQNTDNDLLSVQNQ